MKKLLLILIILASGTFIYLKLQVLGNENSNFNRTTRYKLGEYSWLRTVLGLHNDGDARGWYLAGTSPITIEIVHAPGVDADENALNEFAAKVEQYTGRKAAVFNEEIIANGKLTEEDIKKAVSLHRHHEISGEPNLFIMITQDFDRTSEEVGRTYQEYGIVLSNVRLREVTSQYGASYPDYVESTLLHEFGHQIGLGHNDAPNCIMNERVERPTSQGLFAPHFTETSFCPTELEQLRNIKANLN